MGIMRVMFPAFPLPPPPHNKQLNKPKHCDTFWYQYLFFQCIMQQQKKETPKVLLQGKLRVILFEEILPL